ncbi:hypothetical protein DSO57_1030954 [Entomophthora muscae]|uniref:Uncharacterized protein n=1 Tax=Entomophthora muscae TaxID=34485 RepID=A0ACC2UB70_9FUNG|nr:hypothetical protein DSO57_1030954 [Entomophthora muscae]
MFKDGVGNPFESVLGFWRGGIRDAPASFRIWALQPKRYLNGKTRSQKLAAATHGSTEAAPDPLKLGTPNLPHRFEGIDPWDARMLRIIHTCPSNLGSETKNPNHKPPHNQHL